MAKRATWSSLINLTIVGTATLITLRLRLHSMGAHAAGVCKHRENALKSSTKIWLAYSAIGLIISLAIVTLFDNYPGFRFLSNEGIVFGVMFAQMGAAVRKASVNLTNMNSGE